MQSLAVVWCKESMGSGMVYMYCCPATNLYVDIRKSIKQAVVANANRPRHNCHRSNKTQPLLPRHDNCRQPKWLGIYRVTPANSLNLDQGMKLYATDSASDAPVAYDPGDMC